MCAQRLETIGRHIQLSAHYAREPAYRYTIGHGNLTKEQRDFYETNGFVVIRNLVAIEALERFRYDCEIETSIHRSALIFSCSERFQQVCTGQIDSSGMTIMKDIAIAKSEFADGEKAITKIQDFVFDDELFQYCCLPDVVKYVENFTGPNIMAMHTMVEITPEFLFVALRLPSAHQQTTGSGHSDITASSPPGSLLLPISSCRSHRLRMDSDGAYPSSQWLSRCPVRLAQGSA